ncbi:MAG: RNA polymerase sigma factor [Planctomycetes bacterium]|nr:RNA polymerase sigma factor [Planctomycetota bacterium]
MSRQPLSFFEPDTLFPHTVAKEAADDGINAKELRLMLERCLGELKAKYREPLILYYFEDMNYEEISEIIHIPVSTVGVRLRRGRKYIKVAYSNLNNGENG